MTRKLSDLEVGEIKIGQVIQLPACYGVIVGVIAEYISETGIRSPRYPEVRILSQNGNVSQYFYETMDFPLMDRILKHYNLVQNPRGTEFGRFDQICKDESETWKYLEI